MKTSFGTFIQNAFRKARGPLALFLMLVALGARFTPWPIATDAAILALGIMLLQMLLEVHRVVTTKTEVPFFRSFNEAQPQIAQPITEHLDRTRPTSIRCLGVTLFYLWPFLEDLLGRLLREQRTRLTIELTIIDPSWKDMNHFNDA